MKKNVRSKSGNCSCGVPLDGAHHFYCRACYAHYFRERRKVNKLAHMKEKARDVAKQRFKLGIIVKENCRLCDSPESEMHHGDYSKPKDITWLCKRCHHDFHILERKVLCA